MLSLLFSHADSMKEINNISFNMFYESFVFEFNDVFQFLLKRGIIIKRLILTFQTITERIRD